MLPSSWLTHHELTGAAAVLQIQGVTVPNVKGEVVLTALGIDAGRLTENVIILCCFYVGCVLSSLAVLYLGLPRALRRRPARQ